MNSTEDIKSKILKIRMSGSCHFKQRNNDRFYTEETTSQNKSDIAESTKEVFNKNPDTSSYKNRDVDGEWAYAVFAASFVTAMMVSGFSYTSGIYYVEMLNHFGESHTYTTWLGSLYKSLEMMTGVISTRFIARFGCRSGYIAGTVFLTLGFISAAFAKTFEQVIVAYGILCAMGLNFVLTSMMIVLSQYFHKKHASATAFAMVGNGVGLFVLSMLLEYVVASQGWQISFIVCGTIAVQSAVLGMIYFPIETDNAIKNNENNCISNGCYKSEVVDSNSARKENGFKQLDKSHYISTMKQYEGNKVRRWFDEKWRNSSDIIRKKMKCPENSLEQDKRFWLFCLSAFFMGVSGPTFFVIYKDFLQDIGLKSYYTTGLCTIGIGDVVGRIGTGMLLAHEDINRVIYYAAVMFGTAIVFICHLFTRSVSFLIFLAACFGMFNGIHNILISVVPVVLFGKDNLPKVLGYELTLIGIAALVGPLMAGAAMDYSASYSPGLIFTAGCCTLAAGLMFATYLCDKNITINK